MPNGKRFVTYVNRREETTQKRTDADLDSQPGPERIPRIMTSNDMGMVTDDSNNFGPFNEHGGLHYSDAFRDADLPPGHTNLTKVIYRLPNNVGSHKSSDNQQVSSPPIGVVP